MGSPDMARVPRGGPALTLAMRVGFTFAAQALVAVGYQRQQHPSPWRAAAAWWTVYSSLADLGCLAVLHLLLRREHRSLGNLVDIERAHIAGDFREGFGNLLALLPGTALSSLLQRFFYRSGYVPQIAVAHGLPRWARLHSMIIWPALWATTEELVYLGYALPRLSAQTGNTALAAALVALFWGPVQHPTLPALPDRRYLACRALTAIPVIGTQVALSVRRNPRLLSLILGHWAADFVTGAVIALSPRLPSTPVHQMRQ